jgi:hypothetical protein
VRSSQLQPLEDITVVATESRNAVRRRINKSFIPSRMPSSSSAVQLGTTCRNLATAARHCLRQHCGHGAVTEHSPHSMTRSAFSQTTRCQGRIAARPYFPQNCAIAFIRRLSSVVT